MFPSMTVYPIIDSGGQLRHINFNAFLIIPGTPSTKLDQLTMYITSFNQLLLLTFDNLNIPQKGQMDIKPNGYTTPKRIL